MRKQEARGQKPQARTAAGRDSVAGGSVAIFLPMLFGEGAEGFNGSVIFLLFASVFPEEGAIGKISTAEKKISMAEIFFPTARKNVFSARKIFPLAQTFVRHEMFFFAFWNF